MTVRELKELLENSGDDNMKVVSYVNEDEGADVFVSTIMISPVSFGTTKKQQTYAVDNSGEDALLVSVQVPG
jgi:hypothetical protein